MIWVLHGLVSQTDGAALYHGKGESLVGCEMEVGEAKLSFAYQGIFAGDRLIKLYDHFGNSIYILNGREYPGPCRHIGVIGETTVYTSRVLHIHGMTSFHQLLGSGGSKSYPVLVVLDFFWNSNNHNGSI